MKLVELRVQNTLRALDLATVRPLRAVLAKLAAGKDADADDLAKLADLEAQSVVLRAELAG